MLKITLEVGHVAQRKRIIDREKGFTHDWELFVRSPVRNPEGDLNFVEKVVFNLHNTFVKPKRTIKEPPYVIKESGYAAFEVFIEVYLKNRDETRKFSFAYDLDLQPYKSELKEFIIDSPISDEFRRKCIKGGGCIQTNPQQKDTSSYKSGIINTEVKKPNKNTSAFLDLFGAPIEKSQLPNKTAAISKAGSGVADKNTVSTTTTTITSSSTKEKNEKSKYKSYTSSDKDTNKDTKKTIDSCRTEKVKKDKQKDRNRNEKKEKSSKRLSSSSPSSRLGVQNTSSIASSSKTQTLIPDATTTTSSYSGNKGKKNEREKSEKKDYLKSSKEKQLVSSLSFKEREMMILNKSDDRQKQSKLELKNPTGESTKKHSASIKELERKHKHKKKEKSSRNDKERKNPKSKTSLATKDKSNLSDKESNSDSDKNEKEAVHDVTLEKRKKSSREEKGSSTKGSTEKDDKQSKRKLTKDDRDSSASPPVPKQSKRDFSPSNVLEKSLPDSRSSSNNNNNTYSASDMKVSNDYLDELKDLKHKINLLQTKELHHVVRLIASTGFYEITKSSFNFDLVQLNLVQPGIISQLNKLVAGNISDKKETK
jgi:YEATS domain-containing protein 1/3